MRTPLATIEAYLEALEDGVRALDAPTLEALHGGTQRLHRLAEDISAVSRAEEGQLDSRPVRIRPHQLLESAAAAARDAYASRQVRLVVEPAAALPEVHVDPERMAQVLANLLENALRHTPTVARSAVGDPPDHHWVELAVVDSGDGISPENLPHVFERFYRVDPARRRAPGSSGSGIGLTISRALVEAHGGGLSAASAGEGKGSTFTIRLPAASG